jgi:hypothetical protein
VHSGDQGQEKDTDQVEYFQKHAFTLACSIRRQRADP